MAADDTFNYDVEKSEVHESEDLDSRGREVMTFKCHGRLVSETASAVKEVVKPLIPQGGRIIVDLGGVSQLDSSGLGVLVGLKASAINQGYCILEFANMTPRVLELLRLTHLTRVFSA